MTKTEPKLVVTFPTTSDAMSMDKAGSKGGLLGKLAPIPRQLSAGCGFSWIEPASNSAALYELLENVEFEYEAINELDL